MEVLAIDLGHLWWKEAYSSPRQLEDAYQRTVDRLVHLIRQHEGRGAVVVAVDSPPYARATLYPEYKAQRSEKPTGSVEMLHSLETALRDRVGAFASLPEYELWEHSGYEADDVIATLCKRARMDGIPVTIFSRDKDLLSLVDDRAKIRFWNCADDRMFGEKEVKDLLGVQPSQVFDFLGLCGDSADNIPGCPGVGKKRAVELLESYGSVGGVLLAAGEGSISCTPKVKDALVENEKLILTSRELARLFDDADVPWDALAAKMHNSTVEQNIRERVEMESEEAPQVEPARDAGLNIHQRMLCIMREVPGVNKGSYNRHASYKYTSHEDVTASLHSRYVKHGVQRTASVKSFHRLENGCLQLEVIVSWVNVDNPQDRYSVTMLGEAPAQTKDGKPTAQQSGVALSYAVKNAEFKVFALKGDDTPDADSDDYYN